MVMSLIRLIEVGLVLVGEGVLGSVPWTLRVVVVISGEVGHSQCWTRSICSRHVLSLGLVQKDVLTVCWMR